MNDNTRSTRGAPQKDAWDKAKIILTALTPVTLAALGFYVTATLDSRDKSARDTLAVAERSARLNEGIVGQLDDISAALYAQKPDGTYDLASRVAGMTQLAVLAQATEPAPPRYYYSAAIALLTEYVRQNAPQRRIDGSTPEPPDVSGPIDGRPGVTADVRGGEPPRYRALDIIWALRALQEIRIAGEATTGEELPVQLTGIDFRDLKLDETPGLDLSLFDFSHANFGRAFLSGCICRGAIFHHADLSNTATWNADFREADLRRSTVTGSKWVGVDFTGSIWSSLEKRNFSEAVLWFHDETNIGQPEFVVDE